MHDLSLGRCCSRAPCPLRSLPAYRERHAVDVQNFGLSVLGLALGTICRRYRTLRAQDRASWQGLRHP